MGILDIASGGKAGLPTGGPVGALGKLAGGGAAGAVTAAGGNPFADIASSIGNEGGLIQRLTSAVQPQQAEAPQVATAQTPEAEYFGEEPTREAGHSGRTYPGEAPVVKTPQRSNQDIRQLIIETAQDVGADPLDLATSISFETGGTFNPTIGGPVTKHGKHRGLIQFGEPQARQYGVDWNDPVGSQLGKGKAISKYLKASGFKPGMSGLDLYSTINAGSPGRYGASDTAAGGTAGNVRDKWERQMAGHRRKAAELLGSYAQGSRPPGMLSGIGSPLDPTLHGADPQVAGGPFMGEGPAKKKRTPLQGRQGKLFPGATAGGGSDVGGGGGAQRRSAPGVQTTDYKSKLKPELLKQLDRGNMLALLQSVGAQVRGGGTSV